MPKILSKRIQRIRLAAIMGIVRLEPITDVNDWRDRYTINGYEVTSQLRWLCEHHYLRGFAETRIMAGGSARFEPGTRILAGGSVRFEPGTRSPP